MVAITENITLKWIDEIDMQWKIMIAFLIAGFPSVEIVGIRALFVWELAGNAHIRKVCGVREVHRRPTLDVVLLPCTNKEQ